MTLRERRFLLWFLAGLCVLAALGVWVVLAQAAPARVAAFAGRFADFTALSPAAPPTVTLTVTPLRITAAWPQGDAQGFAIQTQPQPLAAGTTRVQADAYIGGTQNTAGGADRYGFRAYVTLTLWRNGQAVDTRRLEAPLASDKDRLRLNSLCAEVGATGADAYSVGRAVEPVGGVLAQGTLVCAWLEVLP